MPDGSADLVDLLAACASRDGRAFRRLYDLTSAKLLGVANRIVRDRPLAEEIVQEVFLKVWQSASSYSPQVGRPMTWLITITRNRAIDVVRSRAASDRRRSDDDGIDAIPEPGDRPSSLAEADALRRCLDGLEATQRACLLAAYHEGRSREELATRFGRPVNTIKTWLHRSAHALRACLEASS